MKETYRIKPPKHIDIDDPWYYEMYQGNELKNLTIDFLVPRHLSSARVIIEEAPLEDMPEYNSLNMTIFLAPKKTIDTYLAGMYYEGQECKQRPLTVDTAKYISCYKEVNLCEAYWKNCGTGTSAQVAVVERERKRSRS